MVDATVVEVVAAVNQEPFILLKLSSRWDELIKKSGEESDWLYLGRIQRTS